MDALETFKKMTFIAYFHYWNNSYNYPQNTFIFLSYIGSFTKCKPINTSQIFKNLKVKLSFKISQRTISEETGKGRMINLPKVIGYITEWGTHKGNWGNCEQTRDRAGRTDPCLLQCERRERKRQGLM
jgi:hypothetical protein